MADNLKWKVTPVGGATATDPGGRLHVVAETQISPEGIWRVTRIEIGCESGLRAGDLCAITFESLRVASLSTAPVPTDTPEPAPVEERPGPGRARISDNTLRRVAEAYLREQASGPGLRRRMLRALRMPATAEPTIRYWIQRARSDGWLSPGEHGVRGAVPGPRLVAYRRRTR